jgi:hypothetical protein
MHQMHLHQLTPPGAKSSSSHIRAYPPTLEASRLRGSELQLGPQDNQPEGAPAPSDQKLSRVTHSTAQTLPNHLQKADGIWLTIKPGLREFVLGRIVPSGRTNHAPAWRLLRHTTCFSSLPISHRLLCVVESCAARSGLSCGFCRICLGLSSDADSPWR